MTENRRLRVLWAGVCVLWLGACQSEPPKVEKAKDGPAENAEQKPVLDSKIASAMQAAAQAEAAKAPSAQAGAPPADGILEPEAADRELALGKPAELTLGGPGATPKLSLGSGELKAGEGPKGTLEVSYRIGGSLVPTIEYSFQALRAAAAGADPLSTRFSLLKAAPSADQPGRLPPNMASEIAKLNGSSVEFASTRQGLVIGAAKVHAKNDDAQLVPLVESAATALTALVLPRPEAPVGPGAFWMVKSRESFNGADVVVYRMVKVETVTGDVAELSVNTRRYLAGRTLTLEGLPPHSLREFEGNGSATLSLRQGAAYPHQGKLRESMLALVVPNDQPGQAIPVQSDLSATFSAR
ncbi:MAG: hypothetical protein ABW217_11715 [Polyangiaceae bacterium]